MNEVDNAEHDTMVEFSIRVNIITRDAFILVRGQNRNISFEVPSEDIINFMSCLKKTVVEYERIDEIDSHTVAN